METKQIVSLKFGMGQNENERLLKKDEHNNHKNLIITLHIIVYETTFGFGLEHIIHPANLLFSRDN